MSLRLQDGAVTVDVSSAFVDPSNGEYTFTATSSSEGVATVTVAGSVVTVTPTASSARVSLSPTSLTFDEGDWQSPKSVTVEVVDDQDASAEPPVTIRHQVSGADYGSVRAPSVQVTVVEDDTPTLSVEASFGRKSYGVTEGGTVTVVVRLDRDPERDLTIDLDRTHHGGATDADYSGVPSSVTFGPRVTTQEFLFAATDDRADDDGGGPPPPPPEAAAPLGTCEADAETLCLQDSRYAVSVDWRTADGGSGSASVVHSGTNDSGLFTFFNRDNWEVLIKVLDGCSVNGHIWVYGASTTDLGYSIRVTDTVTGALQEYRNEPGLPASAITDGTAFAAACRSQ